MTLRGEESYRWGRFYREIATSFDDLLAKFSYS